MRARRPAAAILAVVVALALTACFPMRASEEGKAIPDALTPLPELTDPQIVQYCPGYLPQHLGGPISPIDRVYVCRADVRIASDGATTYGPWQVVYRLPHPDRLIAAYAGPDATARSRASCGAVIVDPLIIWVYRAGTPTPYRAPVDGCGAPTAAAAKAYRTADRDPVIGVDTGAPDYQPTLPSSPGPSANPLSP
jgi:hypothetical protein